jgi:hypothetical protein
MFTSSALQIGIALRHRKSLWGREAGPFFYQIIFGEIGLANPLFDQPFIVLLTLIAAKTDLL